MSTLISHFELLFKDQAPVIGIEVETVLQGYFLELTNLEERDFLYNIEFVALASNNGSANRQLDNNTIAILDNPGAPENDNVFGQLNLVDSDGPLNTYSPTDLSLRIAAGATALVVVIPQVIPFMGDAMAVDRDFEVRGYVQLSLPPFDGETQSNRPVNVMVSPQNRATFYTFPNTGNFSGGMLRNQTQTSLPTGNGGCIQSIEPSDVTMPA
ncbi:MAG: hypothetical protein AB8B97_23700 [Granulosicoccus sp.]